MPQHRLANGTSLCAGALALAGPLLALPSAANDSDSAMWAYFEMIHGLSTGRLDKALAQFSDAAVVIAGPRCSEADPCVGREAILERYLVTCQRSACVLPLADQRFDGTRLTTRGEVVGAHRIGGVDRPLVGGHVFEFRSGRITSLRVELDTSDARTAEFIAQRSARDSAPGALSVGAR